MPKYRISALLAACALGIAACGKTAEVAPPPPPPPPMDAVLPNVPVPPEGTPLSTESGADVTQLLFITPVKIDSVLTFYRHVLAEKPFRLVSEQQVSGSTVFVAEQDGPGLWVTVKPDSAGGTSVTVAGAANLSNKTKPATTP